MKIFLLVSLLVWGAMAQAASTLGLEDYLGQVRGKHKGLQGAADAAESALTLAEAPQLLLTPTLFGSARFSRDSKPTSNPGFMGTKTVFDGYELGVSKLTTFGLLGKVYYDLSHIELVGVTPAFVPQNDYWEARPVVELSQSLWRNGFGRGTRAEQSVLEQRHLVDAYSEQFKVKTTLAAAEHTYWRLALARETVRVERESLERAERIRDWCANRAKMQLTDRADELQAQAALEVRSLELQAALDEEEAAARAFNSARGIDSGKVDEIVTRIDAKLIAQLQPPADRHELREDVKAAQALTKVADASAAASLDHLTPEVEAFGSLAWNGRGNETSDATQGSFKSEHPTWLVGVRFSAPLDLPLIFQSRAAHHKERGAAEASFQRRLFEQEVEWNDLTTKFDEAKKRLALSRSIESVQNRKLSYEKQRHAKGRTTTYQVLLFEQDFAAAQLNRIRTEAEILSLVARMKTFGKGALGP